MALTVTSRGGGATTTGTTTAALTGRSATLAVGSLGVLCIAFDNAGNQGSTPAAASSITDAKGNVWTLRANGVYDNGAASAGIEGAIYTAPITTALLTTDACTITWAGGVSVSAKAWTWYEVIPSAGNYADFSSGAFGVGATAANGQITTASVAVGNAVVAGYFSENVAAVTQDSDSTNGSWTAQQTQTVGSTTSGVRIATQQKVQTTTPSTQSYDVTVSSQDRIVGYVIIAEFSSAKTGAFTAVGGGVIAEVGQKAASMGLTATGGGVAVTIGKAGQTGSFAAVGGGIASEAAFAGKTVALTATGAGVLTWSYAVASVENHDGAFAATGGGITSPSVSAAHNGTFASTGGGVDTTTAAGGRTGAFSGVGGGIGAVGVSTDRSAGLTIDNGDGPDIQTGLKLTGGGIASVSVLAGRQLATALSGGGVFATDQSTDRIGAFAGTGGGTADVSGTQGEAHDGSLQATGSGALAVAALADRLASIVATGSGVWTLGLEGEHNGAFHDTGGGRAAFAYLGPESDLPDIIVEATTVGLTVSTTHVDLEVMP